MKPTQSYVVKIGLNSFRYNISEGDISFATTEFEVPPKTEGDLFGSIKIFIKKESKDVPTEVTGLVFTTNVVSSVKEIGNPGQKCLDLQTAPLRTNALEQEAILVGSAHSIQDFDVRTSTCNITSFLTHIALLTALILGRKSNFPYK